MHELVKMLGKITETCSIFPARIAKILRMLHIFLIKRKEIPVAGMETAAVMIVKTVRLTEFPVSRTEKTVSRTVLAESGVGARAGGSVMVPACCVNP